MHARSLVGAALVSLLAPPGCDLLDFGWLDDGGGGGGPPADTLPPGTPLDDDIVLVADPLRVTPGDPVELIRDAVETAILYSGFGVRDGDVVVIDDSRSQGITFETWDVDTMADGLVSGVAVTLDDYAGAWADLAGATDVGNFKQALLDDIATAAAGDAPGPRAWAQIIVAMGRNDGYDLLDPNVDGSAPLNTLQLGLLTYPIAAELWLSVQDAAGSQASQPLTALGPCGLTETQSTIVDTVMAGEARVTEKVVDHLGEKLEPVEKYGQASSLANAALAYVKLVWTMVVFRMDMEVTPQPLVRARSAKQADVKATFQLDGSGKAQVINCVRQMANAANVDFTVPEDGPLAGKRVEWEVLAKGDDDVIQTVGSDPLHGETDESGVAHITIQSTPQPDFGNKTVVDVERRPHMRATVNLKNKDLIEDLTDLSGGIGGVGSLLTLPAEILNRRPLLFTGSKVVVVKDKKELLGNYFTISGDYTNPSGINRGIFVTSATDYFDASLELTIVNDEVVGKLLTWDDGTTETVDDIHSMPSGSEGCAASTPTLVGSEEVYTSRHQEKVDGYYFPGAPGVNELAALSISAPGYSTTRGYQVPDDGPGCEGLTVEPTHTGNDITVSFDTASLVDAGGTLVIDDTDGDIGWVFTVHAVQ